MKLNETGRSLTEMLGVLAVIGILSVTGVYGYGIAMKRHKTNELMRELNFRANQVATQLLLGTEPEEVSELEKAFLHSGEYTFTAESIPGAEQFKITVTGTIPEEICRQIYLQLGDNSVLQGIRGPSGGNYTSSNDCAGEHESLSFVYNNDMSRGVDNSSGFTQGGDSNPPIGSSCTNEGAGICTDDVNIRLCTRSGDELRWVATVCDYGCLNGQCRSSTCKSGDADYCFGGSISMKCVSGSWQRTLCNWGCSDGACGETCTTETETREWSFNGGTYGMISQCQNGSWDNPMAFCQGSCSGCTGIDSDALAEFRSGYPSNQH